MAPSAATSVYRAPKGRQTSTLNNTCPENSSVRLDRAKPPERFTAIIYLRSPSIEGMRSKVGSARKM